MTEHQWLTEGAEVAVIRSGWHTQMTMKQVARVTKRDVVLNDGTRYNRQTLHRSGDHYHSHIRSADDPEVLALIAERDRRNKIGLLRKRVEDAAQAVRDERWDDAAVLTAEASALIDTFRQEHRA